MQRLRTRAAELRARLAAVQRQQARSPVTATAPPPTSDLAPVLLAPGRKVLAADLAYAGNATVEAAIQSMHALQRRGDLVR